MQERGIETGIIFQYQEWLIARSTLGPKRKMTREAAYLIASRRAAAVANKLLIVVMMDVIQSILAADRIIEFELQARAVQLFLHARTSALRVS